MISIIVAIAENMAIGRNNELLWHIPEDMKWFRKITSGHTIIMGRRTYLSLPNRPLKNRTNVVISDIPDERFEGCITVHSIGEALSICSGEEECFVIGGGMIYKAFLPFAGKLYVTWIHRVFEADTFFPEINSMEWKETERIPGSGPAGDLSYSFVTYLRRDQEEQNH